MALIYLSGVGWVDGWLYSDYNASISSNWTELDWTGTELGNKRLYVLNKKFWIMRRLKKLGANEADLIEVYGKQVRSIAEYAVPVWNSGLKGDDIVRLERIQKIACSIIFGSKYRSYTHALNTLGLEKLTVRRKQICLKFAMKA